MGSEDLRGRTQQQTWAVGQIAQAGQPAWAGGGRLFFGRRRLHRQQMGGRRLEPRGAHRQILAMRPAAMAAANAREPVRCQRERAMDAEFPRMVQRSRILRAMSRRPSDSLRSSTVQAGQLCSPTRTAGQG